MQAQRTEFWKLFKASACKLDLRGDNKEATFEEIVATLVKAGQLDDAHAEGAVAALVAREQTASTGIGVNVAVPHVAIEGLDRAVVSVSIHPEGVDWESLDGDPAHIFFTVLRPKEEGEHHDADRHLEMMKWISRLAREADFRRFARAAKTRKELVDLLKEMSEV